MSVAEVARALRLSRATVYRLVEGGELPCIRIANSIRFDPEALAERLRDLGALP